MLRRDWLKSILVGLLVLLQQFFGVNLRLNSDDEEESTMRVWLDIYDPTHTDIVTDGPIFVRSAQVRRGLDETGSCSVDLVGIDPRVVVYHANRAWNITSRALYHAHRTWNITPRVVYHAYRA